MVFFFICMCILEHVSNGCRAYDLGCRMHRFSALGLGLGVQAFISTFVYLASQSSASEPEWSVEVSPTFSKSSNDHHFLYAFRPASRSWKLGISEGGTKLMM